jgi:rubrerythrin
MNDSISRQASIDAVKRLSLGETDATRLAMRIEDYLERFASAQPDRKKGQWILVSDGYTDCVKCDKCGEVFDVEKNFCPNCGADMRGEQDGRDS